MSKPFVSQLVAMGAVAGLASLGGALVGVTLSRSDPPRVAQLPLDAETSVQLANLSEEIRALRESLRGGAAATPEREPSGRAPAESPGTAELLRALERWAAVVSPPPGVALSPGPAVVPARPSLTRNELLDAVRPLRQLADDELQRSFLLTPAREILARYGRPKFIWVADGVQRWYYAPFENAPEGSEFVSITFHVIEGSVIRVTLDETY